MPTQGEKRTPRVAAATRNAGTQGAAGARVSTSRPQRQAPGRARAQPVAKVALEKLEMPGTPEVPGAQARKPRSIARRARGLSAGFLLANALIGLVIGFGYIGVDQLMGGSARAKTVTPADRDADRRAALLALQRAMYDYADKHNGTYPIAIPGAPTEICVNHGEVCKPGGLVDLNFLVAGGHIESMSIDPMGTRIPFGTGYTIAMDMSGKIYLAATEAEAGEVKVD